MKDLLILKEQIDLIDKEIKVISEKIDLIDKKLNKIEDIELEVKAIKLFLKRVFPDFKKDYLEILEKLKIKE